MIRTVLAVVAILMLASSAQATGIVFYNQAAFISNLEFGYYLETFQGLNNNDLIPSPLNFSASGFMYSAAAPNDFYSTQTPSGSGNYVLSTNRASDSITLTFLGNNITAVGGYFYTSDFSGNVLPGTITLVFDDGTTLPLLNQDLTTFTGYMSPGVPIASLVLTASQALGNAWPSVDNFYVGATTLPEPSSGLLLLAGAGALLAVRRLRQ